MTGRYRAYPSYTTTDIEWLPQLPVGWILCKLKHFATIKNGKDYKTVEVDSGYPVIGSGGQFTYASEYTYDKPSVLLGRKGTIDKPLYVDYPFWTVDTMYYTEIREDFDAKFVHYLALTIQFDRYSTNTALPSMTQENLSNYYFAVPSVRNERDSITKFLNHETAKIDTLIAKQEKLIELLKEKRQAVISHAVTKGLNPNAPMKDSCVEWLGEVPEHWKVSTNKHLMMFVTSGSRGWAEYYSDEGKLFFRIANLTRDTIEPKLLSMQYVLPPDGSEGERSMIRVGDLLVSITADLGSVCVANNSIAGGYVSQHVALLRPNRQVASSRWLAYFILSDSAKEQLVGAGYGGTKVQLSLADLKELIVTIPPPSEQVQIESYLDKIVAKFQQTMDKANQQIELLKERKSALISSAVTGKIDVRNWQS